MRTVILLLISTGLAFGQAKPKQTAPAKEISELNATKLELLSERLDRLQEKAQPIVAERNKLMKEICGGAGIPVEECQVNVEERIVTRKPKPQSKEGGNGPKQ
ncbi:MAG: hypothetical protein M1541_16480 [Acidobacteria bacterium]|nr:hypothetical protein [Acidobacteriota bacterium]